MVQKESWIDSIAVQNEGYSERKYFGIESVYVELIEITMNIDSILRRGKLDLIKKDHMSKVIKFNPIFRISEGTPNVEIQC